MVRSNSARNPYHYEIWYQFPVVHMTVISAILINGAIKFKKKNNNNTKTAIKSRKRMVELLLADTSQWRHNERDGVSNHQPHDCLLNRLFRHISKKTSKLRVTGLCEGNSYYWPVNSRTKGQWRGKCFYMMTSSSFAQSILVTTQLLALGLLAWGLFSSPAHVSQSVEFKHHSWVVLQ